MHAVWYRSWPSGAVPDGRAYVHDSLPRLLMRDCDYRTVADYQPWPDVGPGLFLLEWDIALDAFHRARFAEHALTAPDRVLVAPYQLLGGSLPSPRQVHRVRNRPISEGREWCETFGFGCIYLPRLVLDEWRATAAAHGRWNDYGFSLWHHDRHGPARVDWSVQPQHLHGD